MFIIFLFKSCVLTLRVNCAFRAVMACASQPCLNAATCLFNEKYPLIFTCQCAPGFEGVFCESKYNCMQIHAVKRIPLSRCISFLLYSWQKRSGVKPFFSLYTGRVGRCGGNCRIHWSQSRFPTSTTCIAQLNLVKRATSDYSHILAHYFYVRARNAARSEFDTVLYRKCVTKVAQL